jgi:hypothetical protein
MTKIPAPPPVTTTAKKAKKAAAIPPSVENSTVSAPTADMVTMTRAEFEARMQFIAEAAAAKAVANADPKAVKEAKKAQAKLDRKAQNKIRSDEALQRCMGAGADEATVKAVFREAYNAARGLSGEEFKAKYNAVCIAKLGVPRYVAKAA